MANTKKRCIHCREYALAESGIITPIGFFCSFEHATTHAQEKRDKARFKKVKSEAKEARQVKVNSARSDYKKQFDLTKKEIQKWVNHVRDAGKPCISCSTQKPVIYCGSHYRTAGGNPEIALDTRNIHRACNRYCNKALSGNISGNKTSHGYTVGLIMRYGQDYVDWLNSYHPPKRYSCEQLRELRAYYAKLTREGIKTDDDRPFK